MAIPRAIVTSEEPDALQVQLAGAILVEQFSTDHASCSREVLRPCTLIYIEPAEVDARPDGLASLRFLCHCATFLTR